MLNRLIRFTLVGVFATAIAGYGVSYAQDDDDDMEEGGGDEGGGDDAADDDDDAGGGDEGGGDEGGGDEGGGDEGGGDEGGGDEGGGDAVAADGAYPMAMVDRPLVLPKGAFEARVAIGADKSFDFVTMGVGAGYGVMPKLEAGVMYAFAVKEFEIKGGLDVYANYSVMKNEKMELTAGASFGYNLLAEGLNPADIGATVKYLVMPKLAVQSFTHLNIFLEGDVKPITLIVPLTLYYQVTPQIAAQFDTAIAQIEVADSATGFIGADFMPVDLTAWYSLDNKIDVGAGFGMDLKADEIGDSVGIFVGAAYRGGI